MLDADEASVNFKVAAVADLPESMYTACRWQIWYLYGLNGYVLIYYLLFCTSNIILVSLKCYALY